MLVALVVVAIVVNLTAHGIWIMTHRRLLTINDEINEMNTRLRTENDLLRDVLAQVGMNLPHYDDGQLRLVHPPLVPVVRRES